MVSTFLEESENYFCLESHLFWDILPDPVTLGENYHPLHVSTYLPCSDPCMSHFVIIVCSSVSSTTLLLSQDQGLGHSCHWVSCPYNTC